MAYETTTVAVEKSQGELRKMLAKHGADAFSFTERRLGNTRYAEIYFVIGYATQQLYKMEHQAFQGYMGDKRKRLVEKHGYDTKNAAHLIRLLRMGIEFLRDGELIVDRGGYDATELLANKNGEWSLERVKSESDRLFKRAEEVYDRSTLPQRPDREKVNELCVEMVRTWLGDAR